MALTEINAPLTKSRSRSSIDHKKLLKSSTTTTLFKSIDIENEGTPCIKEPVMIQSKRTLSKCKAKIDLKSSRAILPDPLITKTENPLLVPVSKVLSKSRTSVKLVPVSDIFPAASCQTTTSTSKSLSKSSLACNTIP